MGIGGEGVLPNRTISCGIAHCRTRNSFDERVDHDVAGVAVWPQQGLGRLTSPRPVPVVGIVRRPHRGHDTRGSLPKSDQSTR
jgi:hypothetical protein